MVAFFAASPVARAVAAATQPLLGFQAVPASVADTIVVPPGYRAEVLIAWGMLSSPMPQPLPNAMMPRPRPASLATTTTA